MPAAVTSHGRRFPRRLADAAIVAAAIGLGWLCLRQIVPDWRAGDPEALSARAIAAFSRAETPAARGGAEAALRGALKRSPLDARLLRTLAVAAELRGDRARAVATMAVAGARGWRDTLTQVWLFSDAVARGDDAAASLHADAVLRQTPELQPNLFPVMIASMRDRAAAVAPYVARLAEAPD